MSWFGGGKVGKGLYVSKSGRGRRPVVSKRIGAWTVNSSGHVYYNLGHGRGRIRIK